MTRFVHFSPKVGLKQPSNCLVYIRVSGRAVFGKL